MSVHPITNWPCCRDFQEPKFERLPAEKIKRPSVPIKSDEESKRDLKVINETCLIASKLMPRLNNHLVTSEMRSHSFEVATNEQFENMQKEMNLMRGHINKILRQMEEVASSLKQQLADIKEERPEKSESVDQAVAEMTPDRPIDKPPENYGLLV